MAVKMITSRRTRRSWWLPLARPTATMPQSIMQSRLSNEAAFQILRQLLSPFSPSCSSAACHVDSPFRSTSMKLMHDCVNGITPELLHRKCNRRAVNGRAVATAASAMRESLVVLPETRHHQEPSPVL